MCIYEYMYIYIYMCVCVCVCVCGERDLICIEKFKVWWPT